MAQTVQTPLGMRNQSRRFRAAGFSLVEMLIVVVLIGMMTLFAYPKVIRIFDQSQVRGARLAVLNKFNAARINARLSSRNVFLIRADSVFWIERTPRVTPLLDLSTRDTVGPFLNLGTYRVAVTGDDTVNVDPRGLYQGPGWKVVFTRGAASDSIIISGFGTVTR
jgi:prepilin-type N-terminal cleavage/methylation domain-containing protein